MTTPIPTPWTEGSLNWLVQRFLSAPGHKFDDVFRVSSCPRIRCRSCAVAYLAAAAPVTTPTAKLDRELATSPWTWVPSSATNSASPGGGWYRRSRARPSSFRWARVRLSRAAGPLLLFSPTH
jgi:hypothetical protein